MYRRGSFFRRMSRIEGGRLYKRVLVVVGIVVTAMVLLWSDDEQPSDQEKAPSITETRKPSRDRSAPWQFRPAPGEPTRQSPRSPAYALPQGPQPTPGPPYSGGATGPYTTTPRPYAGYGLQPQQRAQEHGTIPRPLQYPGNGMPYGYSDTPSYRFRPLDEKKGSHRYRGHYPRPTYTYPGAPQPGYGPDR